MDMNRIEQAIENKVIGEIQSGHVLKFEYGFMDATPWMEKALKNIDMEKVMNEVTEKLQHELAEKIANKIITEMGTDIKKLMSNVSIRDEFAYMLRKNTELVLEKINKKDK
jgi:hypothetical protein